jgi:ribosomal protein S18 acetylase RimI-like enzyme
MKPEAQIVIPNAPVIPGLTFRYYKGEVDHPQIAALIAACKVADKVERSVTVDDIAYQFRHLVNCDPQTDMLLAEVNGQVIAYGRVWWKELNEGIRLYFPTGSLHPDWRGKGLGSALWEAAEEHIRTIAARHPKETPKFISVSPFDTETALITLLKKYGYTPIRYETHMVRDLSEPFIEAPMPPGFEVRPVKPEHYRPIFDASNEAFRDHWGAHEATEEDYKAHLDAKEFCPELWKVAWVGDQVASAIHNYIDKDENREYLRKRGYTEDIITRRPWRKLGVARSLLVQSMKMFKEMGYTETALSVDSQNLSGAFRLYEGVGYRKVRQQTIYTKSLYGKTASR